MRLTALLVIAIILIVIINFYITHPRRPQCYGLYLGQNISADQINSISNVYGQRPAVILTFVGWSDRPFKTTLSTINAIKDAGAIPMITLEPWLFPSKTPISIQDISKEENVLKEFGAMLKEYNAPVFLRFAHEMNGNWYPWTGYQNQKQTTLYIDAWKKVHDAITKYSGNTKIYWVWSINAEDIPSETWNEPKNYYPGDNYVDMIGIDGYNQSNRSFDGIFKKQIKYVRRNFKGKTIFITETASGTAGIKRSKWINNFFHKLYRNYSDIPLFIWFDMNKESDWNLNADGPSIDAFKNGLKGFIPKKPNTLLEEKK